MSPGKIERSSSAVKHRLGVCALGMNAISSTLNDIPPCLQLIKQHNPAYSCTKLHPAKIILNLIEKKKRCTARRRCTLKQGMIGVDSQSGVFSLAKMGLLNHWLLIILKCRIRNKLKFEDCRHADGWLRCFGFCCLYQNRYRYDHWHYYRR